MDLVRPAGTPVDRPGLDGVVERRFGLVVMGDVRIEVRAALPEVRFTELTADRLTYAPARIMVAGTAVNLARRATGYFRRIAVTGKIGDDDFTPLIRRELRRLGVRDLLRAEPGAANAVSVMLRDRATADGPGVRLLVAEEHAPSRRLTEADVRRAAGEIRRADVLFTDGYSLLSPISAAALRRAAAIARRAGTLVAFDVVPHDVDARLPAAEVTPVLELADIVITEAATVARLLGRPAPVEGGEVRELLPALDALVPGRPLWLLRFGPGCLERVLAHQRGRLELEYATGYGEGVERAGFGDRLTAGELYWWLSARSG
ncbi:PfkB family carbohydrate kinase [Actinomadura namibiensis]|uniref:Sugar/nucleoside kinase (Ribokinase family) n=1 Tax=Actinomadura namibiensis TaxID=182080 RepID=A0A7W3LXR5_ACTNM|nr:PfkB family carbohydrate kinase [Actinomadura namibiensis]MBA8956268.1 sugar/nucleoside kinase (ribokinase family) [Actinomadura namibiensis]